MFHFRSDEKLLKAMNENSVENRNALKITIKVSQMNHENKPAVSLNIKWFFHIRVRICGCNWKFSLPVLCQSQHPSHGIQKAKMSHPATIGINKKLLMIHLGLVLIIQRERFSPMSKLLLETFQQDWIWWVGWSVFLLERGVRCCVKITDLWNDLGWKES